MQGGYDSDLSVEAVTDDEEPAAKRRKVPAGNDIRISDSDIRLS